MTEENNSLEMKKREILELKTKLDLIKIKMKKVIDEAVFSVPALSYSLYHSKDSESLTEIFLANKCPIWFIEKQDLEERLQELEALITQKE